MYLNGLGHFHPSNVLDNAFLESLDIGTNDQWITERVGIKSRRTVLPLDYIRHTRNEDPRAALEAAEFSNAETGKRAAELAIARAGLKPSDIGMVIAGGCSPDECIPAEACRIAEELGITAPSFDLNSACSSFGAQLYLLDSMKPERLPDFVLIVSPENTTRVVNYRDRASCVLWGDGTSAAVVSPRVRGPWEIVHTTLDGDPSGAEKVVVPRAGHFTQNGAAVQAFAIKRATEVFLNLREAYVKRGEDRTQGNLTFIGHQANLRMLENVQRRCEIPDARHFYNVDRCGNTGASGAPTVMSENWDNQELGDAVALAVVGSGLAWAGALFERTRSAA